MGSYHKEFARPFEDLSAYLTARRDFKRELELEYILDPFFNIDHINYTGLEKLSPFECATLLQALSKLSDKLRAQNRIRNTQPLKKAWIYCSKKQYHQLPDNDSKILRATIADEISVKDVEILSSASNLQFLNVRLSPNYEALSNQGMSGHSTALKMALENLSVEQQEGLHQRLVKKEKVTLAGVDLLLPLVNVKLVSKPGFASLSNENALLILDTLVTPELRAEHFIEDLRVSVMKMLAAAGINREDKLYFEISASGQHANIIKDWKYYLCNRFNATDIVLDHTIISDKNDCHRVMVDNDEIWIKIYKED